MKKKLLLLGSLIGFMTLGVRAQAPFNTVEYVDINNIRAAVLSHGDLFSNPATSMPSCEFPKGSGKHINYSAALWISGYDFMGQLRTSAQTYRMGGNDFWPGPIDSIIAITHAQSSNWARLWKVNLSDIQYFLSLTSHDSAGTPASILEWPGKGNSYAKGNGGVSLTVSTDMAPFVDLNHNGSYEPLLGDYPDIKGDQALWWVFNDNGPTHNETNGMPMYLEIHGMAYAYKRGTLIDNVIYFDYTIANKSRFTYSGFRFGLWDDMDLGYGLDDFIAFDSSHRMGITYNGSNDDGGSAGHPTNSYGTQIPMAGITLVDMPGDAGSTIIPAGSFSTYQNDASVNGNPSSSIQYSNYLHSKIRNGASMYTTMPTAYHCREHDSTRFYVYSGAISDTTQCTECGHNTPGDRRFIITSNDTSLPANGKLHFVMALVTTNPQTSNGCPGASFSSIKTVADTAWHIYHNPPVAVEQTIIDNELSLFPNPAENVIAIETKSAFTGKETIRLTNTLGQGFVVGHMQTTNRITLDISALAPGMYVISLNNGIVPKVFKFVKL